MPSQFGVIFATISLAIGLFFFVFYATRYYVFSATVLLLSILGRNGHNGNGNNGNGRENGNHRSRLLHWIPGIPRNGNGNHKNGSGNGKSNYLAKFGDQLIVEPFVSIHLPLFNEPNVAERLLTACTTLDYKNYEVIVIDDSTDETTGILRRWVESNNAATTLTDGGQAQVQVVETLLSLRIPVKIVHRNNRGGFKGGALNEALKHMNPKAEYVIIFDADFIPPPDIIRRFLAYLVTSSPSTAVKELLKLDKVYADGKITLDAYLAERLSLSTKLVHNGIAMESFQLAHHSLFELDQLFAEGAIDQGDYLVRRKAIMRELSKSSRTSRSPEDKLALKQAFTICKLFSEDKIDPSDFKTRMRTISTASSEGSIKPTSEAPLFLQILELDQQLAKGTIDIKTYGEKRTTLTAQLLALTENRDELKTKFELDQQLAKGKITLEEYLEKRNGNGHSVPPSRIVQLTSKISNGGNGNGNGNGRDAGNGNGFVAVQGYQLHYLNRSENWLTQGIRAEFSGSYMIERTCEEILGAMKMIAGSVYMIKADIVRKFGWSESLTEDWELTCRLYRDGKRVVYTPTIQAPAECPSTLKRLIRQRQRWAEGHTYNAKRYFWSILKSPHLTVREKLEFAYFAPYYLQSVFFILGTFLWLVSEYLHEYPPFWTQSFGWALLLSNLMALPLMNLAGLFSEGTAKKDLSGIFSAIVLSYILSVFQAYAALKGLLEKREGTWIRTYKTGVITETIRRFKIGKFWLSLKRPGRRSAKRQHTKSKPAAGESGSSHGGGESPPRGSTTTRRTAWKTSSSVLPILLVIVLSLSLIIITLTSFTVQESHAIPASTSWYLYNNAGRGPDANTCSSTWGTLSTTAPGAGSISLTRNRMYCWATTGTYAVSSADSGNWVFHLVFTTNYANGGTITVSVYFSAVRTTRGTQQGQTSFSTTGLTSPTNINVAVSVTVPNGNYYVQFSWTSSASSGPFVMTTSNVGSTLTVPEGALVFAVLAPLIPLASRRRSIIRALGRKGE